MRILVGGRETKLPQRRCASFLQSGARFDRETHRPKIHIEAEDSGGTGIGRCDVTRAVGEGKSQVAVALHHVPRALLEGRIRVSHDQPACRNGAVDDFTKGDSSR